MDYKVEIDYIHFGSDAMIVGWSSTVGFGQLTVYRVDTEDGEKFTFDTEGMGVEFRNQVLDKIVAYILHNERA